MVQSSITAWLSKPAAVKQPWPATHPLRTHTTQSPAPPSQAHQDEQRSPLQPLSLLTQTPHPPFASTTHPLPPNVELRPCAADDLPALKRLTALLLPIPYPDKFFRDILSDPTTRSITLTAIWHDSPTDHDGHDHGKLVGAIRCRLLACPPPPTSPQPLPSSADRLAREGPMLYLSTLALLAPYRGHGIAAHMLALLLRRAAREHGVVSVGAHVWEVNEEALRWYGKRGFRPVGREDGYYRKLRPQGAVLMRREVGVLDLVGRE